MLFKAVFQVIRASQERFPREIATAPKKIKFCIQNSKNCLVYLMKNNKCSSKASLSPQYSISHLHVQNKMYGIKLFSSNDSSWFGGKSVDYLAVSVSENMV